jgi:recombination endonuclease VII
MNPTEVLKICGTCLVPKPLDEFHKGNGKFGRNHNCKPCAKLYRRSHYKKNRDKVLRQNKAWSKAHPEQHKALVDQWTKKNRGKTRDYWERWRKKRWWSLKYGITKKDYARLAEFQGNRCAICKCTREEFGRRWQIDHDHKCCPGDRWCGKCIRGLLCMRCNMAIGLLRDSSKLFIAAMMYLEDPPTKKFPGWRVEEPNLFGGGQ